MYWTCTCHGPKLGSVRRWSWKINDPLAFGIHEMAIQTPVRSRRMRKEAEPTVGGLGLTSVHVNLPTVLWKAVAGMAEHFAMTKTNVLVRALNREAYFTRVLLEDPGAKVYVEHSNGDRESVAFV